MNRLSYLAKRSTNLFVLGLLGSILAIPGASALPQNGQVIGGTATITQTSPAQLTINQSSANAAINWNSFSIGKGETTTFVQPNDVSVAFNRVTGVNASIIAGNLVSNGQVVLVNPNGMIFTKTAAVNVGGLTASTSGITQANAIAGNFIFDQKSLANAQIVNAGTILSTARDAGLVALVSPNVVNSGVITARFGKVALASGDKWTMDYYGDHLVQFAVDDGVAGSVTNSGNIVASHGNVLNPYTGEPDYSIQISANVAKGVLSNVINMDGVLQANGIVQGGGNISLTANGGVIDIGGQIVSPVTEGTIMIDNKGGDVDLSGKLRSGGQYGGYIAIDGAHVTLGSATIDAGGAQYGGYVVIGGGEVTIDNSTISSIGYKQGGTVRLGTGDTQTIEMDADSLIDVKGIRAGSGGNVTMKASETINVDGTIDASAGPGTVDGRGGNGGRVVMDATNVYNNGVKVDVSAPFGKGGVWLINGVKQ